MTERIVDISEKAARLRSKNGCLQLDLKDGGTQTIPFVEVAVVVVAHPQVTVTAPVLARLAEAGGVWVVCDERRMPVAWQLPIVGHHLQVERFRQQVGASRPTHKRLWKQIVQAKLRAQASALRLLRGTTCGIDRMVRSVRSGDTTNVEAQAARRYWGALFVDRSFRRDRAAADPNRHLNYGYAVLRALVARAVCAAGLHPSLGIHHHNRYSGFPLADDLMEPFRPLVDLRVARWFDVDDRPPELDRAAKRHLLAGFTERYRVDGEERSFFDIVARVARSLAAVFAGKRRALWLPEVLGDGGAGAVGVSGDVVARDV
ncbi:MAG: type II CRISPR-associated endonuclease Cas1 [Planctomycetota bacterium]|nr:MAG: type II CRISPR-associated endonuclease Cas1 [Planctomycetota bacterium]